MKGNAYHRMRQLQRTRLQSANDAQRFPHDDILCILASDLGLEAIRHVGIRQPLDALWQRPVEDDIEGILVVSGAQGLRLGLARFAKAPGLFVKGFLAPVLATSASGRRGEMPAARLVFFLFFLFRLQQEESRATYQTREIPVRCNRKCLILRGSDRHSNKRPVRWALAASCSPPRKTI